MASIVSEIREDLQRNFSARSSTSFNIEYNVVRSLLGKNLEKIKLELEKSIKQFIIEELEYNKNFEITITIQKDYDNDFIIIFLFTRK